MTVKIAPERGGPRDVEDKLVDLIHNAVPSHSGFRHHWKNEHRAGTINMTIFLLTELAAKPRYSPLRGCDAAFFYYLS
jgi:hypothetical protein